MGGAIRRRIVTILLRNRCEIAIILLRYCCAIDARSRPSRCEMGQKRCGIAVISRDFAVLSMQICLAIASKWLQNGCEITAKSLHNRFANASQSMRDRCEIGVISL